MTRSATACELREAEALMPYARANCEGGASLNERGGAARRPGLSRFREYRFRSQEVRHVRLSLSAPGKGFLVLQSGAVRTALAERATADGLGIAAAVSLTTSST